LDLTESDTQKGVPAQRMVCGVQMQKCNKPCATAAATVAVTAAVQRERQRCLRQLQQAAAVVMPLTWAMKQSMSGPGRLSAGQCLHVAYMCNSVCSVVCLRVRESCC